MVTWDHLGNCIPQPFFLDALRRTSENCPCPCVPVQVPGYQICKTQLGAGRRDTGSTLSQVAIPSGKVAVHPEALVLPFSAQAWSSGALLQPGVRVG